MAIDALTATGSLILNPLVQLWNSFVDILPGIIAAIIILIIGYFVALGIGHAVRHILEKAGLDKYVSKSQLTGAVGHMKMSSLLGDITKWYVFLIFLQAGVDLLSLGTLSLYLDRFVLWLPNVIIAAVVVIFGLAVVHFIAMKIEEHTDVKGVKGVTKVIKGVMILIVLIIALQQIGVKVDIVENLILIVVGALAVGLAIALGIGLGNGLKIESKDIVKDIKDMLRH